MSLHEVIKEGDSFFADVRVGQLGSNILAVIELDPPGIKKLKQVLLDAQAHIGTKEENIVEDRFISFLLHTICGQEEED